MDSPGLRRSVKAALDDVNRRARHWTHAQYGSDKYWSMQVFKALEHVIQKQAWGNSQIAGGYSAHNVSEWLYDLTVYTENDQYYTDVCLVCECEWSYVWDHIADDFLKLCQAKSPFKIFIFGASSRTEPDDRFDNLTTQARFFEVRNLTEEYLLACWNQGPTLDDNRFHYRDLTIGA
jgi:hypothetical protein